MTLLRKWLKANGVTQEVFAEMSGVPQPLLSKYSRGLRNPDTQYALAIEAATKRAVPAESWKKRAYYDAFKRRVQEARKAARRPRSRA